jgi:hypothetical protein
MRKAQERKRIVIDGKEYTSGQIAWSTMTGHFPGFIIDHKDGYYHQ